MPTSHRFPPSQPADIACTTCRAGYGLVVHPDHTMSDATTAELQTQLEYSLWKASMHPSARVRKGCSAYAEELAAQLTHEQITECSVNALIMCAQMYHPRPPKPQS